MSDRETTENFWAVWNSFKCPEPKPIFYRCYYQQDGTIDFYTMEDLPGLWIEVDRLTYLANPISNARVVDGKLKILEIKKTIKKLKPSQNSGTTCDPRDVAVVTNVGVMWSECDNEIN